MIQLLLNKIGYLGPFRNYLFSDGPRGLQSTSKPVERPCTISRGHIMKKVLNVCCNVSCQPSHLHFLVKIRAHYEDSKPFHLVGMIFSELFWDDITTFWDNNLL